MVCDRIGRASEPRCRFTWPTAAICTIATTSVGYASSSESVVRFGLGDNRVAERVEIHWPGGRVQTLTNVAADRIVGSLKKSNRDLLEVQHSFGSAVRPSFVQRRLHPEAASYQKANELFVAKKFPESFAAVEEALRLDPNIRPALTLRAKLAMAANRYDVARESLERALKVDPQAAYAQFLYGMEAFMNNDMQAALPQIQEGARTRAQGPPRLCAAWTRDEKRGASADAGSLPGSDSTRTPHWQAGFRNAAGRREAPHTPRPRR